MMNGELDILTREKVEAALADRRWIIETHDSVTSTNTMLRESAAARDEYSVVIASSQTGGRGRRGRSFYSPDGTGLYMSLLLRPTITADRAADITTAAAVAVCEAIESLLPLRPAIKWVNDIFIGDRKACGILTEASFTPGGGSVDFAVLGVGINVYEPGGGFPADIESIACALARERREGLRPRLAAAILDRFGAYYDDMLAGGGAYIARYRERSLAVGREVTVLTARGNYPAFVEGIDDRCRLLVRRADGTSEVLSSGEISIRLS